MKVAPRIEKEVFCQRGQGLGLVGLVGLVGLRLLFFIVLRGAV